MKKVASFALAAALAASLVVPASAAGIAHTEDCSDWNEKMANGTISAGYTSQVFAPNTTPAIVSRYTRVSLPRGVKSVYTSHQQAITSAELVKACEDTGVANLTVFKQRNVENVEAGATMDVRLWTVGKKNSTIVLFRAEGAEEWTVLAQGEAGQQEIDEIALPGNGAYAVCMAW